MDNLVLVVPLARFCGVLIGLSLLTCFCFFGGLRASEFLVGGCLLRCGRRPQKWDVYRENGRKCGWRSRGWDVYSRGRVADCGLSLRRGGYIGPCVCSIWLWGSIGYRFDFKLNFYIFTTASAFFCGGSDGRTLLGQ